MLAVLLLTAAGCSSPSTTATPASTATTGTIVITPQFDSAQSFSDGVAAVRIGDARTGRWGYIDKAGHYVVNPQFDEADSFSEGLAAVRIGDKWGFISR